MSAPGLEERFITLPLRLFVDWDILNIGGGGGGPPKPPMGGGGGGGPPNPPIGGGGGGGGGPPARPLKPNIGGGGGGAVLTRVTSTSSIVVRSVKSRSLIWRGRVRMRLAI
jgi:hypothetical protein